MREGVATINHFVYREFHPRTRLHVEETEAGHAVLFQQTLVDELFLQLLDLRAGHFAAIWRHGGVGFAADLQEFVVGSRGEERREEFFFHYGELALEAFHIERWRQLCND